MSKKLIDQQVYDLIQSAYTANALYTLTRAGVFDRLLLAPATPESLAATLSLDPQALRALLQFAHAIQLLEHDGEAYSVTQRALPLTEKDKSWLRAYLLLWGEQLNPAFARLPEHLASGANAFELAHGRRIWDFYAGDPAQNELFVEYMTAVTSQSHLPVVIEELDLHGATRLLDVGGGTGSLACGLAQQHPALRADVCDQPSNGPNATQKIAARGLAQRCAFIGANIFAGVPAGYALYTIKHVLHDWDDANAAAILRCIARAMDLQARLLIVEGLLDRPFTDTGVAPEPGYLHARNIEQRLWTPGRVRTLPEFEALCAQAGLRIEHVAHSRIVDISYLRCAPGRMKK